MSVLFHSQKVTHKCFVKCVHSPGSDLDSREKVKIVSYTFLYRDTCTFHETWTRYCMCIKFLNKIFMIDTSTFGHKNWIYKT